MRSLVEPAPELTAPSQLTAVRVLGRNMDVATAMSIAPPSPEADAEVLEALSSVVDAGNLFQLLSGGDKPTAAEPLERLLRQVHARLAARLAPGEPEATLATGQLALLSSAFLAEGDGPVAVEYELPAPPPAGGRNRMRRFLSVARGLQAAGSSSPRRYSVTVPAALRKGKLQALGVGRDCGGKASLQTTLWTATNPFQGHAATDPNPYQASSGGLAWGATPRTPVVYVGVDSCSDAAATELTGLAQDEEVAITFPATPLPAELLQAAQAPAVHTITCAAGEPSQQTVKCPYGTAPLFKAQRTQQGPFAVEDGGHGAYTITCSGAAAGTASFSCLKVALESKCLSWDGDAQTWSPDGCRVVSTTLDDAFAAAGASSSPSFSADASVRTTCSCARTGAFAATVSPRLASFSILAETPLYRFEAQEDGLIPSTQGEGPDAPVTQSSEAAALFLVFLVVFHLASFLIALILYSRWGQAHLITKHTALLLQSKGAKRLVASLVEADAAKKQGWTVGANGAAPATAVATTTTTRFEDPLAEKMRAYGGGQGQGQGQVWGAERKEEEDDDEAKARRALYEAEQLYVAAQDRQRFFHALEKGPTTQQLMAEVAYHEIGAFLTSKWLQQQAAPAVRPEEHEAAPSAAAPDQLPTPLHLQQHLAAGLHMTIRPLAPALATATTAAPAGPASASAAVHSSLQATRLRRLDLQRAVLLVVKHLLLLLVCVGRFEAPTADLGPWALRDCGDLGAAALSPSSVCVQPQQFIFRNLIQFVLLLPVLLLLYILLPGQSVLASSVAHL